MPRPKQKFSWIALRTDGDRPSTLHVAPLVEMTRAEACANAREQRNMFASHAPPGAVIVVDVYVEGNDVPIYSARRAVPSGERRRTTGMLASTGHVAPRHDDTHAPMDDLIATANATDDPEGDHASRDDDEIVDITAEVGARVVGRMTTRERVRRRANSRASGSTEAQGDA